MTRIRSSDAGGIDDRRGSGGGGGFGGLGGLGGGGFPIPMRAGGGILGVIVLLASLFLPKLLGAGSSASGVANPDATDGTCNSELEQIVCGATNDIQQFWTTALPKFYNANYVPTKTVFFSGSTNTGCGQASSETGPFFCPVDNEVYIDLTFMQALEQQFVGTTNDLAEQYIVAHEYGHYIQDLLGVNAQVQQAQQANPGKANQYSVALELQADCYAGVWVNDVNRRGLLDSTNEVNEALSAAAAVGDDRIQQKTQGRIDPEKFTHGTAAQRQQWFSTGFSTGDPRQCTTFNGVL